MIGTRVSHYEILEQLGQGGMGVVFKARDVELDRFVALKFLSPHLGADPSANARFIQEAKAASALDHTNICSIFEISKTENGQLFIVMPFYAGNTLKYLLQSGPLGVERSTAIARQIASGLQRAHEAGIVHRDIKPANIMVTDRDEVKILDFGIAKLGHGQGLTQTGSTLGTTAYMSPEQASGGVTDNRSDLWAVGVLLYEMLCGSRPFEGDYDQAVIYGILNEKPKPVIERAPSTPKWLSDVARRLLAKDPTERYQSAGELAEVLEGTQVKSAAPVERPAFLLGKSTWIGVAVVLVALAALFVARMGGDEQADSATVAAPTIASAEPPILAVLPFSNLKSDPETDFLGYALADQVIGSLTYVKDLSVRPASSVRQYKGTDYDVQEAGTALGADYVMAGNYLQQDDRVRLTVELVDVASREMIWREPIELEYKDVFEMQDMVAERLLNRLEVQFSPAERSLMKADVPADPLAYEYFLRALSHPEDRNGNLLAVSLLEQAIARDSTFAPAWDQLGVRLRTQGYWDLGGQAVTLRAKQCFERAIELNPDLLSAQTHVSLFYAETGDIDRAYEAAQRVLSINENHPEGHFARGYVLRYAGAIEESAEEMRLAIAGNATNPTYFRSAAFTFRTLGNKAEAIAAFELGGVPGLQAGWEAIFLREDGEPERAIAKMEKAGQEDPGGIVGLWAESVTSAWRGDFETGLKAARKWEAARLVDGEGVYFLATMFCLNRDFDHCIELLNKSVDEGYYNYRMYEVDSFLDGIRDQTEFQQLAARARRKSEAFAEKHLARK